MDLPSIQRAIESLPQSAEEELGRWLKGRVRGRRAETRRARHAARQQSTLRSALLWTAASLLVFFAVQGLLFHSGWYSHKLEPDSSAGMLEGHMTWLTDTPPGKLPEVLMIGDSRTAEGFSARVAEEAAQQRYDFWNIGVPGSTPRIWYYMLREVLRTREPAAIVIGLDRFTDEDGAEIPQSRITDLNYLTGRLRLTDCPEFASSMEAAPLIGKTLGGCLFRGLPLRADVHDFLLHRRDRLKRTADYRIHGHGYIDGYGGKPEVLTGLTADLARREIHFPPGVKDWQKETVQRILLPAVVAPNGSQTRYRRKWLGGIVELFRGRHTRLIFVEMPRAPLPLPDAATPPVFLREALRERNVYALPADTFHDLERPETFADGLHLNSAGRTLFSARLGERVARELRVAHEAEVGH